MQIDWRAALVFVTRDPSWKPRIAVGGPLMLLVPPVGWVLALGCRSLVCRVDRRVSATLLLLSRAQDHERARRAAAQLQQVPT